MDLVGSFASIKIYIDVCISLNLSCRNSDAEAAYRLVLIILTKISERKGHDICRQGFFGPGEERLW